jgi:ElaB/YqjD/DUF883 family membrane-anchored ribosome-binding protein
MDENRIAGVANGAAGRVEDAYGALKGDYKTQFEGKLRQAKGAAQDAYGKVSERMTKHQGELDDFVRTRPWEAVIAAAGIGLLIGLLKRR